MSEILFKRIPIYFHGRRMNSFIKYSFISICIAALLSISACKDNNETPTPFTTPYPQDPSATTTSSTSLSPSQSTSSTNGINSSSVSSGMLIKMEISDLTAKAELIIIGTVEDLTYQRDTGGNIFTLVTVSVEQILKGEAGENIVIRVPGGTVDGQTLISEDAPEFKPGERVVLFLQQHEATYSVLGGFQGKFTIVNGLVGNVPVSQFIEQIQGLLPE